MAHNPDTSYLRCQVAPHELELRFTFDPATLHRIVRPDADGDGKITRAEMEAMTADIFDYLEANVRLEINGKPVKLGERNRLGWPAETGDAIAEKDYHTQLLHFTFQCRSQPLIEDVYVCYEVFAELGDRHRIIADITQDGRHQEVIYTMFEPDYLYDTFWKAETLASASSKTAPPTALPDSVHFRSFVERIWGAAPLMMLLALLVSCQPRRWISGISALLIFGISWRASLMGFKADLPSAPFWLAGLASFTALLLAAFICRPLAWLWDALARR